MHSILTSKYQIKTFLENNFFIQTIFFGIEAFFQTRHFSLFSPNPYTRMCVSTIESLSLFREIVKNHCNLPVKSWFFGFSLIFDFSVYFNYS